MADQQKLLAVLIDVDNISPKYAKSIMGEITRFGEPALRRAYGDWSSPSLAGWKAQASDLGMLLVQETANTTNKNASDIGLVIDAMDILHEGRFEGFVLVSSDSDFTALARRLRENGVEVIGIGEDKAPDSLRNACSRFILIPNIIEPVEERSASAADATPSGDNKKGEQNVIADDGSTPSVVRHPPSKVVPIVRAAMKAIDPDQEWYHLGAVGQHITRAQSDFDPRNYGSAKLSDLLRTTGQFELKPIEGHLHVRRKP